MWRITKYDPELRDPSGAYTSKTWTSVYDIGSSFNGAVLSAEDYRKVEDAYVDAVRALVFESGAAGLRVADLERNESVPEHALYQEAFDVSEGDTLSGSALDELVRRVLREELWCELLSEGRLRIRFGYDYYMYGACREYPAGAISAAKANGLFVEEIEQLPGQAYPV